MARPGFPALWLSGFYVFLVPVAAVVVSYVLWFLWFLWFSGSCNLFFLQFSVPFGFLISGLGFLWFSCLLWLSAAGSCGSCGFLFHVILFFL